MPQRCSFGCEPSNVPMHRFPDPFKYPDRFKKWVTLVGGKVNKNAENEYFKKKRVCDLHFSDQDRNRFNRLNNLAVPSLCLRALHHPEALAEPVRRVLSSADSRLNLQPDSDIVEQPKPSVSSLNKHVVNKTLNNKFCNAVCIPVHDEHNYSAASKSGFNNGSSKKIKPGLNYSIQTRNMRTQINYLRSEVCRLRKARKFSTRLHNASKLAENCMFQKVVQRMTKPAQLFIHMQLQTSKNPKGRRFSIEEKILSLSLYKRSPKMYPLLQKYFTLPSAKAMKRLLGQIKLCPGINPVIFEKIKKTILGKDIQDRLCSLSFDEMSLQPQVHYNSQKDTLEGFATNKESQLADHALVFMIKGVKQNFKQPIAYYFTSRLNKTELKQLIITVINHAHESGLIVLNTVCDQSTVNVGAITGLVEDTKAIYLRQGKEWRQDIFDVNGTSIVPLYDTPHLIKGLRNNLLTKDLQYETKGIEKIVKWEYFQKVYAADKSYGELKLLHKITEEHVNPDKINKMRVKTATQIFSHSVAVVTEHLSARGDLPMECRQLIDLTLLLDNLFDSLNVNSLQIPNGKIFKGPIRRNSPHHQLWEDSIKVLKTIKFLKKETKGNKIRIVETTVPSVKNLIKTIHGMEAISQILFKKYGFDAMLTRNFNQDPVENFFGNVRSYGARNNSPNSVAFESAFKALLLNNYNVPHSKRANCEEDGSKCLQNFDFFLKESHATAASDVSEEDKINLNENVFITEENTDAGQRNYVCGWVLTKCLKNVCKTCQHCRETLLDTKNINSNSNYTRAKEYCNKKWLCYPSKEVEICFQDLQNITQSFLEKNVQKKHLRKSISQVSDLLIEYPFNCTIHKEQLKSYFVTHVINLLIYSWCKSVNKILAGKITYEGTDELKIAAAVYYNKHKHNKNNK